MYKNRAVVSTQPCESRSFQICLQARIFIIILIGYGSAPCGSGKTHQSVNRAVELVREGERVLFLSPTKELSTKTAANELMGRVRSRIINEDTVGKGNVTSELAKHFKKPSEFAESLVFATHAALPYLRFIANQRHWHVIIDEELQVIQYVCHRLPKMHGLITDDTRLESHNSIYSRIVPCNMSALEEKAKNKDDDEVYKVVAGTIGRLLNPHWLNYVNTEQYERLRRGESQTLAIHSILSPSIVEGFASLLMTAANFEDTALYQLWSEWNGAEDSQVADQYRKNCAE